MLRFVMTACLLFTLASCDTQALQEADEALDTLDDTPAVIHIETSGPDVCWTATVEMSTKEGCGSQDFNVQEDITVANAQKQGTKGTLSMSIEMNGEIIDEKTTSAQYGMVQVSE